MVPGGQGGGREVVSRYLGACVALLIAALLVACGKPEPGSQPATNPQTIPPAKTTPTSPMEVVSASGVAMVALPGGEFIMGSDKGNEDESPAHKVTLTAFLLDQFEVTHELFAKAQLPNPSHWQDNPKKPVERVRWRDAKQYCNERSLLEGLKPCYNEKTADLDCNFEANGYRLPTEAEWEYACRAGGTGDHDFGAPDKLRQFAWFADNSDAKTHAVGERKPNRWGIHDLYGNVSEWCEDVYAPAYYKDSPVENPPRTTQSRQGRETCHAWRFLEGQRHHVSGLVSSGPEDRRHGRLLLHRLLWCPLRAPRHSRGDCEAHKTEVRRGTLKS